MAGGDDVHRRPDRSPAKRGEVEGPFYAASEAKKGPSAPRFTLRSG